MPSKELNRAFSGEEMESMLTHSITGAGVENVGRNWLDGHIKPEASTFLTIHTSHATRIKWAARCSFKFTRR
jgi:hypothetical protein